MPKSNKSKKSKSEFVDRINGAPAIKTEPTRAQRVEAAFDRLALKRICEMREEEFAAAYGMTVVPVKQKAPADFYAFKDNGANILAVAHLDTVSPDWQRQANFVDTAAGPVIFSRALDDRLGAYIILELLPALGINVDWLVTTGEECGQSTAAFFAPPEGKDYNWIIEFDRGGCDVVLYQFEDDETVDLVEASGARVEQGIFSDIAYLEHLEVKAFNWGTGYRDYHGPRSHAFLEDTFRMVGYFLRFHEVNAEEYLPHEEDRKPWWSSLIDDEQLCDICGWYWYESDGYVACPNCEEVAVKAGIVDAILRDDDTVPVDEDDLNYVPEPIEDLVTEYPSREELDALLDR